MKNNLVTSVNYNVFWLIKLQSFIKCFNSFQKPPMLKIPRISYKGHLGLSSCGNEIKEFLDTGGMTHLSRLLDSLLNHLD